MPKITTQKYPKGCLDCKNFKRTLKAYDEQGNEIESTDPLKDSEVAVVEPIFSCLKGFSYSKMFPWLAKYESISLNEGTPHATAKNFTKPHCYEAPENS